MHPDRTLVLDLDVERALVRATADGTDRLEAEGVAFQRRVRDAYLRLAEAEPARVRLVDADGGVDEVAERIFSALADLVGDGARHE